MTWNIWISIAARYKESKEKAVSFDLLKDDLRTRKTKKSLIDTMSALLERHSFRKMTIKDICEGALISRATFYSHFIDKYDLLRYWLINLLPNPVNEAVPYEVMEKEVNQFVDQNKRIVKNILENADQETLHIVFDVILLSLGLDADKNSSKEANLKYTVYSNIFAGGIVYYLLWHVENKFPSEVMNTYLYDLIKKLCSWEL